MGATYRVLAFDNAVIFAHVWGFIACVMLSSDEWYSLVMLSYQGWSVDRKEVHHNVYHYGSIALLRLRALVMMEQETIFWLIQMVWPIWFQIGGYVSATWFRREEKAGNGISHTVAAAGWWSWYNVPSCSHQNRRVRKDNDPSWQVFAGPLSKILQYLSGVVVWQMFIS